MTDNDRLARQKPPVKAFFVVGLAVDWIGLLVAGLALVGATCAALALAVIAVARRARFSVRQLRIELRAEAERSRQEDRDQADLRRVAMREDRREVREARAKPPR
jgi:hypothetical protein